MQAGDGAGFSVEGGGIDGAAEASAGPPADEVLFVVAEMHDQDPHELRVLVPAHEGWLPALAEEYRRVRTMSRLPAQPLSFEGVDILDVSGVESLLAGDCVPQYEKGNFGVARSDLAEVIQALVLEKEYGCRFGYRSVRDRELRQRPGRGIDQIGIEGTRASGGAALTLVLGEAKVSTEAACPPQVVDSGKDCLRKQHLDHLADREATAAKIVEASRHADDPDVQVGLRIAAILLRREDERLRVVAASAMVRPEGTATPDDFGTFHSSASDYAPATVRFLLVRLPGDVDEIVEAFTRLAQADAGAAA